MSTFAFSTHLSVLGRLRSIWHFVFPSEVFYTHGTGDALSRIRLATEVCVLATGAGESWQSARVFALNSSRRLRAATSLRCPHAACAVQVNDLHQHLCLPWALFSALCPAWPNDSLQEGIGRAGAFHKQPSPPIYPNYAPSYHDDYRPSAASRMAYPWYLRTPVDIRPGLSFCCTYRLKYYRVVTGMVCVQARAMDDPFEILGVQADATEKQLKKAYRRLALRYASTQLTMDVARAGFAGARYPADISEVSTPLSANASERIRGCRYHPDLNKEEKAEAKFKALREAYELLLGKGDPDAKPAMGNWEFHDWYATILQRVLQCQWTHLVVNELTWSKVLLTHARLHRYWSFTMRQRQARAGEGPPPATAPLGEEHRGKVRSQMANLKRRAAARRSRDAGYASATASVAIPYGSNTVKPARRLSLYSRHCSAFKHLQTSAHDSRAGCLRSSGHPNY